MSDKHVVVLCVITKSVKFRERTIHEKPDRPRFSICNQREIGGSEPVFSS